MHIFLLLHSLCGLGLFFFPQPPTSAGLCGMAVLAFFFFFVRASLLSQRTRGFAPSLLLTKTWAHTQLAFLLRFLCTYIWLVASVHNAVVFAAVFISFFPYTYNYSVTRHAWMFFCCCSCGGSLISFSFC